MPYGNKGLTIYHWGSGALAAAPTPAHGVAAGDTYFATNGRKEGEAASAGTGVLCYFDGLYWIPMNAAAVSVKTISGATKASPGVLTVSGHGFTNGDVVTLAGVGGMTELNGRNVTVTVIDANSFSIGVDTTGFTTYTSGGTATKRVAAQS